MSTATNQRVMDKLRKVLALARQGVGGEKENAASLLAKLLNKYGLTIEDLDDQHAPIEMHWWRPKGPDERTLLTQCLFALVDGWDGATYKSSAHPGQVGVKLNRPQWMEVDLHFDVHRRALAKHMRKQRRLALLGYIHANELFGECDESDPDQTTSSKQEFSQADIDALAQMVAGMQRTSVRRALVATGRSGEAHQ